MSTDPKTYTLTAARAELARRECAEYGHAPSVAIRTIADRIAQRYVCDCGQVSWAATVTTADQTDPQGASDE